MKLLILSDIHANLSALRAILEDVSPWLPDGAVLLGDLIDYGMRPNETVEQIKQFPIPILANLWGNHEYALMREELTRFSSERGCQCSQYTNEILTQESRDYMEHQMDANGMKTLVLDHQKVLLVHGSLLDPFWKSIELHDDFAPYLSYDIVFSGHSHRPHCFDAYGCGKREQQQKVRFINPGSVGQPRNQNPCAQYARWDTQTGSIHLKAVPYDVTFEQSLYTGQVDIFYRDRLALGV